MDLEAKLAELKYDYVRLQNDLEKKESLNQNVDPLIGQLAKLNSKLQHYGQKWVIINHLVILTLTCYDRLWPRKEV